MAKLLFAGGRSDSVIPVSGTVTEINGSYDGTYSDAALNLDSGVVCRAVFSDPASAPMLVPYSVVGGHTVYLHASVNTQSGFVTQLCDSSGYPWVQTDRSGNVQYNTGTGPSPVWTTLGTVGVPFATLFDFDIKLDIAASGPHTVTLLYNRVVVLGPTNFTLAGLTNIQSAIFASGSGNCYVSQLMATEDLSTVGGKVKTVRATGAGANTDWSGAYTDVNEQRTDDSTINQATTAGLVQSYPMSNVTVPTGYVIAGVFHWVRAKNNGNAPTNIKGVVRRAGTNYTSSGNLNGVGVGFGSVGARYDTDPSTGAAWTQAGWNAPAELGYASAT